MKKHKFRKHLSGALTMVMLLSMAGQSIVTVAAEDIDADPDAAATAETIPEAEVMEPAEEETIVQPEQQEPAVEVTMSGNEDPADADANADPVDETPAAEPDTTQNGGTESEPEANGTEGVTSEDNADAASVGEDIPNDAQISGEDASGAGDAEEDAEPEVTPEDAEPEDAEPEEKTMNQANIVGSSTASGVTVSVNAPIGSFPEGTTLKINPISSTDVKSYMAAIAPERPAAGFDISFEYDGNKVQPADGSSVELSFTISGTSTLLENVGMMEVYHIGDQTDRLARVNAVEAGSDVTITVNADEFSPFIVVNAGSVVAARAKAPAKAPENYTPKQVNVVLSNFTVESTGSTMYQGARVDVNFDWDASGYGMDLHEGDYFVVDLPNELKYTEADVTIADFDLIDKNGTIFGTAHIDRDNGTVKATFNSTVEERYGVKGTMWFQARVDKKNTTIGEDAEFTISDGVNTATWTVKIEEQGPVDWPGDLAVTKSGGKVTWGDKFNETGEITQANWAIYVKNTKGDTLQNFEIRDKLASSSKGAPTDETYVEGTFRLSPVESFNGYSPKYVPGTDVNGEEIARQYIVIDQYVEFGANMQSFTLTLPNDSPYLKGSFVIQYQTTFTNTGEKRLYNQATVSWTGFKETKYDSVKAVSGGGTATGDIANRIKLVKVDAEDNTITLAGAEFEVKKPNGETFTLTTGSDGTVTSSVLEQGVYTIKEITAPTGYVLDETAFTVTLTADGVEQTITNDRIKTEINVEKKWEDADNQDGLRPEDIIVKLLADEEDTGKTLTLNEENKWKGTFEDLDTHANGEAISYTVEEVEVDDYDSVITGSPENGYEITNTHEPGKTEIKVTKNWEDADDQDGLRPDEIIVKLLADEEDTGKTLTLNEENQWTGSFTELNTHAAGEAISYSVEEVEVNGYDSVITGNSKDGYEITNTHETATVDVSGSKTWDDAEDQDGKRPDSIEIKLLADENVIQTITVTAEDDWSWNFTDLPKFKNQGTEIKYTILEKAVTDYSTTYDGYDVTNSYTPGKTSISVTKAWKDAEDQDGLRSEEIIVKLLADEEDTGKTLTLNAENQWTGSFTELNTHAAGEAISYSVEEVEVDGYDSVITGNSAEGYVITNTHTPETIEVKGVKEWKDNDNKNGKRPERIEINLLVDGEKIDSTSVTGDDDWTFRFADLPKYRDQGTEIVYTIEETAVDGYTTSITGDTESGFVVTNTEKPEELKEDDPKKPEDPKEEDPKEEDPKDPEKPEEPKKDEPTRPGNQNPPTNTNRTTVTTRSNNTAPATGDASNLALWITVMLLSMGALLFFVNYRKKNHK